MGEVVAKVAQVPVQAGFGQLDINHEENSLAGKRDRRGKEHPELNLLIIPKLLPCSCPGPPLRPLPSPVQHAVYGIVPLQPVSLSMEDRLGRPASV